MGDHRSTTRVDARLEDGLALGENGGRLLLRELLVVDDLALVQHEQLFVAGLNVLELLDGGTALPLQVLVLLEVPRRRQVVHVYVGDLMLVIVGSALSLGEDFSQIHLLLLVLLLLSVLSVLLNHTIVLLFIGEPGTASAIEIAHAVVLVVEELGTLPEQTLLLLHPLPSLRLQRVHLPLRQDGLLDFIQVWEQLCILHLPFLSDDLGTGQVS